MAPPFPSWTKIWHTEPYPSISPTRPGLSARGRVVVVTGGGTGIGAAIVGAFATAGSTKIAIISRNKSNLDDTKARVELDHPGVSVLAVAADVTKELEVGRAFADIEQAFGKVDVFVNNSGYISDTVALGESESGDWWQAHEVNVLGSFLAFKGFHAHASPKAFVLNITSAIAHMPAIPAGVSAYASSKAGSTKLFDYIAAEYPQYHVVNIQPGVVASDVNRKSKIAALDHVDLPGHFAVWLTSGEAEFLRGKFVFANWDVEELKARQAEIIGTEALVIGLNGVSFANWAGL
ncbi:hypothetical protein NQ176_g1338 [Zarea fungicola]|uniref:Uncharacterized protein n=1 Tax=Zarea fungicola TaxID=93591 RepID=A0ACC1NU96_9HYPO|nr:hypothetical protein NQ176_g1338 [Lecanicillium fungicola]